MTKIAAGPHSGGVSPFVQHLQAEWLLLCIYIHIYIYIYWGSFFAGVLKTTYLLLGLYIGVPIFGNSRMDLTMACHSLNGLSEHPGLGLILLRVHIIYLG